MSPLAPPSLNKLSYFRFPSQIQLIRWKMLICAWIIWRHWFPSMQTLQDTGPNNLWAHNWSQHRHWAQTDKTWNRLQHAAGKRNLCLCAAWESQVNILMHPQMSWQSSQSSFHCSKSTSGTNKSLAQIRLWHAPPSSQEKGRAQRTLGLGTCEQTVRWVYGLNQRSVKYRACRLRALLRSPPDIKCSGHLSLSRYMTFTAADMFDALSLHWHWSNTFQNGTAPDYFRTFSFKNCCLKLIEFSHEIPKFFK